MNAAVRRIVFGASLAILPLVLTGCPARPPDPLTPEYILKQLSEIILQPQTTCAELRDQFGVTYLPLADTPGDIGIDYLEYYIPASDRQRLRVWYMPGNGARGTIIVSPGAFGAMTCYLFTAKLLTDQGWSVVIYDYEGFGLSTGEGTLAALRPDLETVLQWTLASTGATQVSLMGVSLGSIGSVAVAVDRPDLINAVVLDSPVALGQEIERFRELLGVRTEEIIASLDTWLVSEDIIGQMHQPLLVFLHEADIVTPPASVQLLYDLAAGTKELVRYTGEHAAGQFQDTADYDAHLQSFLVSAWNR
jgi:uncharacterized protein